MDLFSQSQQRHLCKQGLHHGRNFCIYCGQQLVTDPFFPFRVLSSDGKLSVVVKAFNEHHAKRQLRDQYPPSRLTARRIAGD